jgi:AraC-like DNA-binding protein
MVASPGPVSVRAWKPPIPGVREVLHARFDDHAYPPHTHDAWTLFIVDQGSVRYDLDRHEHGAEPAMVSLLPPHVVHDGRAGRSGGYRKRVIYLEPDVLGEALIGRAVDRPAIADSGLRQRVAAVHDALECADDALEAETRLAFVTERIRRAYGSLDDAEPVRAGDLAEGLRALFDRRATETVTMADAAAALGASPTQLARAFVTAFGITPHAYVLARRLDLARDRILDGQPLASVAAEVGFFDQAHLTRRFKRFLGVTPGRFAADPVTASRPAG